MNVLNEGQDGVLVSIAMCTYNGEVFLDQQIQSILDQTFPNLELVIIDDCSADGTFGLLQSWHTRYPSKIKIFKNEKNLGYNKNFEKAISLCKGDFIAISDQDDIWLPDKIEKLIQTFSTNDILLSHCASIHLLNNKLQHKSAVLRWEKHFSGNNTASLFLFNQIQGHNMVFRKSLTPYILPLPPDVYYDWWIATVATCYGKVGSVPEYLVQHRMHQNNAYFQRKKPSKKESRLYLLNTLKEFSTIKNMAPAARHFLEELILYLTESLKNFNGKFDFRLFRFIYKNRWIIFGHKKRLFPEWTLLKASFKYSKS